MTRQPRVTIGLPVYNGERYLEQSLAAILGQTFEDLELVIADNASTDATEEICRAAAARDPRVRYHRHSSNLGAAANYNAVVGLASGVFFRWATHDDVIAPALVERCVEVLTTASPEVILAFPDTVPIDEVGAELPPEVRPAPWRGGRPHERLAELLLRPDSFLVKCEPVFGLMRTDVLRRTSMIGSFEGSDDVLIVELAALGEFHHIREVLDKRRVHAASSREANVSHVDRARWFDTSAPESFPSPRTRLLKGYVHAVTGAQLDRVERWRCLSVIGRWVAANRRWRVIAGEARIASRERASRALRRGRGVGPTRGRG